MSLELIVGRTYRVKIDDCCVEAWFTSELISISEYDGYSCDAVFANGVKFATAGKVEFEEIYNA